MRFTVKRSALAGALSWVSGAAEKRTTIPVLSNVLLVAKDGSLRATCSDLEIEASSSVEATVYEEGSTTVAAVALAQFATLANAEYIELTLKDNRMSVNGGKARLILGCLPADSFPSAELPNGETLHLPGDWIEWATKKCLPITRTGDMQSGKSWASCVELRSDQRGVRMMSSDGARLMICRLDADIDPLFNLLMSARAAGELSRMAHGQESVSLVIDDRNALFCAGSQVLNVRQSSGRMPDYEAAASKMKYSVKAQFSTSDMRQSTERSKIASGMQLGKTSKSVFIAFSEGGAVVRTDTHEHGDFEDHVDATVVGDVMVECDVNYYGHWFSVCDCDRTTMELADARTTFRMSPESHETGREYEYYCSPKYR